MMKAKTDYSRIENRRSSCILYLQFSLIKLDVRFFRIRLSNHLLPEIYFFAWPSSIAYTGVPGTFGFNSVAIHIWDGGYYVK